jgi:hypothetical protein
MLSMTLDAVSNRLNLDDETTRWLVRLLYEEGTDVGKIGDRQLPRGTPVYAEASANALEVQRAMARNHVRTLFVIRTHEALATVDILDLALHIDALMEGAGSSVPEPMASNSGSH